MRNGAEAMTDDPTALSWAQQFLGVEPSVFVWCVFGAAVLIALAYSPAVKVLVNLSAKRAEKGKG